MKNKQKRKGETKMKKTINLMVSLVLSLALVLSSPVAFAMPDMPIAGDNKVTSSIKDEDKVTPSQKQDTIPFQEQAKEHLVATYLGVAIFGTMGLMLAVADKDSGEASGDVSGASGDVSGEAFGYTIENAAAAMGWLSEAMFIVGVTSLTLEAFKQKNSSDKAVKNLVGAIERYVKNVVTESKPTEDDHKVLTDFAKDVQIRDYLKKTEVYKRAHNDNYSFAHTQGSSVMAVDALHREHYRLSKNYPFMSSEKKKIIYIPDKLFPWLFSNSSTNDVETEDYQDYIMYVVQTIEEQLPSDIRKHVGKNPKAMPSYNALVTIVADIYGEFKQQLAAYSSK